ncbi:MAG: hypothetical protein ACOCVN_01595 [bacterium]
MSETSNIFSAGGYNKWGRITGYSLGNGLTATLGYDEFGFPASAQIPGVQNMEYKFDELTGNLLSRKDILNAAQDTFNYDNLMKNRLETWQVVNSGTTYSANYAANGNISSKTGLGTYSYDGPQPHAVTGVENTGNLVRRNRTTDCLYTV